MIKKVSLCLTGIVALIISIAICHIDAEASDRLARQKDKYIVVIDPGHGGDNLGTDQGLNSRYEKEMDYITALAAYNELIQYDNVDVYLSRTEDVDLSLKKRAEYAASVKADYLFSIHYNASVEHKMYGAEVWVSQFAPYNQNGYQFGVIELEMLQDKGLFIRGVKTRKSEEEGSDLDYYGIIRHSIANGITPVIIEHCHVDQAVDAGFCETEEQWKEFGVLDATAIAKYLGLYSKSKGVDYRNTDYQYVDSERCVAITFKDETPPEYINIEVLNVDADNRKITINVDGCDSESPLMYYCTSLNGGLTFSDYSIWPGCDTINGSYTGEFKLELDCPEGMDPNIVLRAYNMYDNYTDSASIHVDISDDTIEAFDDLGDDMVEILPTETKEIVSRDSKNISRIKMIRDMLLIILLVLIMTLISVFVIVTTHRKRKQEDDDQA